MVWIELRHGPDGPYGVRPRYRPEDYVVPASELRSIVSERGGYLNVDDLMGERDGPFVGWAEVGRFERDGKRWVRLRQPAASWCVDVEVLPVGLGDVAGVDPLIAYDLALAADRALPYPVIYERATRSRALSGRLTDLRRAAPPQDWPAALIADHQAQARYAAAVAADIGCQPVVGQFALFAVSIDDVTYIGAEPGSGAQHVARWPAGIEYLRPQVTPATLGAPRPVRRLLRLFPRARPG